MINIVSVSGGKDSGCTLLLAKELGALNLKGVFADTGHEHPLTYEYIDSLERQTGIEIERVKADFSPQLEAKRKRVAEKWPAKMAEVTPGKWLYFGKARKKEDRTPVPSYVPSNIFSRHQEGDYVWRPALPPLSDKQIKQRIDRSLEVLHPTGIPFLDLCLWKGRFPSSQSRFCTDELKRNPIIEKIFMPLMDDESISSIFSWQGIRWDESESRSNAEMIEDVGGGLFNFRPILPLTAEEVFNFHKKHGVTWNPLYQQGMSRVGCMPCIMSNKNEIKQIAQRYPEEVARVYEWEQLVSDASLRGGSNFFHSATVPGIDKADPQALLDFNIYDVVEWAKTTRGGRIYDLLAVGEDYTACSSAYGLCE
jgi:3'-phosphoadenosine 5'-phosphosulfate sulfotransferase (PAPS reductase)/FAD synthetase